MRGRSAPALLHMCQLLQHRASVADDGRLCNLLHVVHEVGLRADARRPVLGPVDGVLALRAPREAAADGVRVPRVAGPSGIEFSVSGGPEGSESVGGREKQKTQNTEGGPGARPQNPSP